LSELQNKHIIRHLRAYCTDSTNFHEFLPAIAAAINGNVNTALGTSPFFILYGMNYRFPFETALTSNELSFRDVWDMPGLESLAKRLEIIRDIVHQNIREARATTERIKNVNAKPHDFQVGDRVFVSAEMDSSRISNRKHAPAFIGPFVVVQLKNNLAKLVHFYTGKPLKNFINVDKLKRLRDEPREVLYNRHRPTQQSFSMDSDELAQRTVQPAIEQRADGAQNSLDAIGAALKRDNSNSLWQAFQREQDEIDKVIHIEKSKQTQAINLNETSDTRVQSLQLQSTVKLGSQSNLERQVKHNDLLPLTSTVGQQLPVRSLTRPMNISGREIGATHGAETPRLSRRVNVSEQQMHRGHNPVATESQEADKTLHFMALDSHNNDPSTTRGSNLTALSGIVQEVHDSLGSKLCNRNARTEQIALTTHKPSGVNSGHAQSGDSIEDSTERINSAKINEHGEAALTANAAQTFISNASTALAKTNGEGGNGADMLASDTKIKDSIKETNESFTNPLLLSTNPKQHALSTRLEQHPVEKEEHGQKQPMEAKHNFTSYRRVDLNTTEMHLNDRIIRVSARKAAKPYPLYKAHFNDKTKQCWIPVTAIPPEIVAAFHVKRFQRKKTRKLTK
jgi:hypothetical protein